MLMSLLLPTALVAQRPDSAAKVADLTVTVTRGSEGLGRLGASLTVLDSAALHRGRIATGLDEALAFVPGLITGNRWNYSVDQRLTIRGFGARANFGVRGIKVILDGVPQTLPDGQSTLTNLELSTIDHVEVLRGAASSLYGNASGGVLAFTSRVVPSAAWQAMGQIEGGTFGTAKEQVVASARRGSLGTTVAASRFTSDGFRQHSSAEQRRLSIGSDWFVGGRNTIRFRLATADDPRAENPGALTLTELAARRDSASASNVLRGADKRVTQTQGSVGILHQGSSWTLDAAAWGLTRSLDNPLATPPPPPITSTSGTWVGIERKVWGMRAATTVSLGGPRLTTGVDLQTMRDDRENQRATGGVPTGTILLHQRERVTEFGLFSQVVWPTSSRTTVRAGLRQDATRFIVRDQFLSDGDASGARTLASWSGNVGLSVQVGPALMLYSTLATAFETPTTTELANRPSGDGGFNPDLGAQRSVSEEVGMRGRHHRLQFELALYRIATRDAIVAWREIGGRTFYRNAGATRTTGAELGSLLPLGDHLALLGTWTWTHAIFNDYEIRNGTTSERLDGSRLAGVPEHAVRLGLQGMIGRRLSIDVDHAIMSSQFADDRNTLAVAGWGAGVTGVRMGWKGGAQRWSVAPFAVVTNLFDRKYVGSVTLNGAGGRVFEPAAGRALYLGVSLGTHAAMP